MKFENLNILLTCHSLEDFPVHHEGEDADSLLANWTALWHPFLLAKADKLPTWIRTFEVPDDCAGHLFLCPTTSDSELQTGFARRVTEEGGRLVRRKTTRQSILDEILADLDQFDPQNFEPHSAFVDDFFALGYCYLQIQLLTRQLRYSSNLDEVYFCKLALDAAAALLDDDTDTCQQRLQSAFDLLMEERDNYYPVNALLIDLTLTADTTLGENLRGQVNDPTTHTNLLLTGNLSETLATANPSLLSELKQAVQEKRVTIVGGTATESRLPLLSAESIIEEFATGQSLYEANLGSQVDFFGRRRYGLSTFLPQVLEHFGFRGGFHFTLDDGRFPEGMQLKSFWEGDGDAQIEIYGKIPLDANNPGNFLNLGVKIGESFDMDHAAAVCFVHWPGQNCIWYDDLKRICKYGSVLGKFASVHEFLEEMEEPYQHDRFTADQYQSPYFKQAVIRNQPDPISRSIRYWRRVAQLNSIRNLDFLTTILNGKPDPEPSCSVEDRDLIADLEAQETSSPSEDAADLDDQLNQSLKNLSERLLTSLSEMTEDSKPGADSTIPVLLNPNNLVQRVGIELNPGQTATLAKPVYAVSELESKQPPVQHVVCDVPPIGYAMLQPGTLQSTSGSRASLMVDELTLRNEFIEIIIDRTTGGIRALHDYKTRGNRLSQVLAYRAKRSDSDRFGYSEMRVDSIKTLANTTTLGEIETCGKLIWEGRQAASFRQRFRLIRGSRVVEAEVELGDLENPESDPWNWYFGSRFAYDDESSLISTTMNQTRQIVTGNRLEAPHYIDLETPKSRTSILTGGVPWHVRRGDRYIDSIYIVKNESCRHFRFGIAVDLPNPLQQAMQLGQTPLLVQAPAKLKPDHCWFFHFDSKNVTATAWQPTLEAGKVNGCRVRILESMGRETRCKLSCFRDLKTAHRVRFSGERVADLPLEDGKVSLHLAANQLLEVEVVW